MKNLPDNAKQVYKGVIFEVWQWDQAMFDGTTQVFERVARADAAMVLAVVGDKILISKELQPDRAEHFISLPGGRIDDGEEPLQAAQRELQEETGYTSKNWSYWRSDNESRLQLWEAHIFIARDSQKTAQPKVDPGEKIESKLITFDELLMLSEEKTFRCRSLIPFFYHLRLHANEREDFKQLLFG